MVDVASNLAQRLLPMLRPLKLPDQRPKTPPVSHPTSFQAQRTQDDAAYLEPASVGMVADVAAVVLQAVRDDRAAQVEWVARLAAQFAAVVVRQMLPDDDDRVRADATEAALQAVTESLPALVEAAQATLVSTVLRDRDGKIKTW